ncbi:MAG: hypothetical protein DWQ36_14510 [Acidobacteria bacterium]|nr:MAG: hypothetical protein DWQ30_03245 [Acidobacteriota bacterium]REK06104.1 MAG: hypothetical protein DWQ36_14510 [Acidobacteriota bacterium]
MPKKHSSGSKNAPAPDPSAGSLREVSDQRCTGAELRSLIERLPSPDEQFLSALEEITRQQPELPRSAWDR